MRKMTALAVLLALASPAQAADSALTGCYAEGSIAGTFLVEGDRAASASVGAGCIANVQGPFVVGGGIRADLGDYKAGSIYGRLGLVVNPHVNIYALGEWRVPDFKIATNGQLHLGPG